MKIVCVLLIFSMLYFTACHKKTIPQKTEPVETEEPAVPSFDSTTNPDLIPAPALPTAMIVIDGYGRILTPVEKLPEDANLNPDYSQIARSFTPKQMANLKARYQTIPPKVLYIPEEYAKKSAKGTYCIYKKKFWYWKKTDGLFYLDETYYL